MDERAQEDRWGVAVTTDPEVSDFDNPHMSSEVFHLNYWKVAGALCRAFDGNQDSDAGFWDVVVELSKMYPQFDWRNVMTDRWPMGEGWQEKVTP